MEEIKELLLKNNEILDKQNKILTEQNNIMRAGILAFIQEFSLYRYYSIKEGTIPAEDIKAMHDGCEGYASTNLHDLLSLAESYSKKAMKGEIEES
jgi:hypothetical protein